MPTCPQCGSTKLRRSKRSKGLEKYARLFNVFPYRCDRCRWRGLLFSKSKENKLSLWQILFFLIIVSITVLVLLKYID